MAARKPAKGAPESKGSGVFVRDGTTPGIKSSPLTERLSISGGSLKGLLDEATDGNTDAALALVEMSAAYIDPDETLQMPHALRRWLSDALVIIGNEFRASKKRGKQKDESRVLPARIARALGLISSKKADAKYALIYRDLRIVELVRRIHEDGDRAPLNDGNLRSAFVLAAAELVKQKIPMEWQQIKRIWSHRAR